MVRARDGGSAGGIPIRLAGFASVVWQVSGMMFVRRMENRSMTGTTVAELANKRGDPLVRPSDDKTVWQSAEKDQESRPITGPLAAD